VQLSLTRIAANAVLMYALANAACYSLSGALLLIARVLIEVHVVNLGTRYSFLRVFTGGSSAVIPYVGSNRAFS
jgi:hypothetical protein